MVRFVLSKLPKEVIRDSNTGDEYLHRYTLLWTPIFRVYLHHILRSDSDRDLHDHPWNFVSIILRSGYLEHVPGGAKMRMPGDVVVHRAKDLHRVQLTKQPAPLGEVWPDIPAWTLVFCGRKKRVWGFQTKHGWMSFSDYFHWKLPF
ncbi:MAG: hypothetical protein AMXMBFR7_33150 [Planctomycetota bacterium]